MSSFIHKMLLLAMLLPLIHIRGAGARLDLSTVPLPFGQGAEQIKDWAAKHGLRLDDRRKPTARRVTFNGCPLPLPQCVTTRFSFARDRLSSLVMTFEPKVTRARPIGSFHAIKQELSRSMGDPWFDRERAMKKPPTIPSLKSSGQALVTSWTGPTVTAELRLDVGSTEGHLLRLVLRAHGKHGAPASIKVINEAVRKDNKSDATLTRQALEVAVNRLRKDGALEQITRQLGRAPRAKLVVIGEQVAKHLSISRLFMYTSAQRTFAGSRLLYVTGQAHSRELKIGLGVKKIAGKRYLTLRIRSLDATELWKGTFPVDEE